MKRPLDRTDREILAVLQNDARISNKALAERIGLAPSSCLERVRRLEEQEVLLGAHAEVAAASLGIQLQALVMARLHKHKRAAMQSFRRHALSLDEVVAVYLVAGQHDFMIHVAVPGAEYLRDFVLDKITIRPEVVNVETSLIFDYTRNHRLPDFHA